MHKMNIELSEDQEVILNKYEQPSEMELNLCGHGFKVHFHMETVSTHGGRTLWQEIWFAITDFDFKRAYRLARYLFMHKVKVRPRIRRAR